MPKYKFDIVMGSIQHVKDVVSAKLSNGWILAGSMTARMDRNDWKFIQPMMLEVKETKKKG